MAGISKDRLERLLNEQFSNKSGRTIEEMEAFLLDAMKETSIYYYFDNIVLMMRVGANNLLLKTLEEAPKHSGNQFTFSQRMKNRIAFDFLTGDAPKRVKIALHQAKQDTLESLLASPLIALGKKDINVFGYTECIEASVERALNFKGDPSHCTADELRNLFQIVEGMFDIDLPAHHSDWHYVEMMIQKLGDDILKFKDEEFEVVEPHRFYDDHLLNDFAVAFSSEEVTKTNALASVIDDYLLDKFKRNVFHPLYLGHILASPALIGTNVYAYAQKHCVNPNIGGKITPLSLLVESAERLDDAQKEGLDEKKLYCLSELIQKGLSPERTQQAFLKYGQRYQHTDNYLSTGRRLNLDLLTPNFNEALLDKGYFTTINPHNNSMFNAEILTTMNDVDSLRFRRVESQFKAVTTNPELASLTHVKHGALSMLAYISARLTKNGYEDVADRLTRLGLNVERSGKNLNKKDLMKAVIECPIFEKDKHAATLDQNNLMYCLIDNNELDAIKIATECGHNPHRVIEYDPKRFIQFFRFKDTPSGKATISGLCTGESTLRNHSSIKAIMERGSYKKETPLTILVDGAFYFEDDVRTKRQNGPLLMPAYVKLFTLLAETAVIDKALTDKIFASPHLTREAFIQKLPLVIESPLNIEFDQNWDPSYQKSERKREIPHIHDAAYQLITAILAKGKTFDEPVNDGESIEDFLGHFDNEALRSKVMNTYLKSHGTAPARRRQAQL